MGEKRVQKNRSMDETSYQDVICVECGSGDKDHRLLLCDKCDQGYHMSCVKPIIARIPIGKWYCPKCSNCRPLVESFSQRKLCDFFMIKKRGASVSKMISLQDSSRRKRRARALVHHKKKRKLLPYVPSKDPDSRLQQMQSLAFALTSLNLEFSDDLTYPPGMAQKSANNAKLENGGMQVSIDSGYQGTNLGTYIK